ncbi:unnamed protein product, partial [marine sediment metagenome]
MKTKGKGSALWNAASVLLLAVAVLVFVAGAQNVDAAVTATASSEHSSGYPASKAIDANPTGTYWAGKPNQGVYWLALDFGAPETYNKIVGYWPRTTHIPNTYVFQSSDDGGNWTDIPGTYVADDPGYYGNTLEFADVTSQHLRIYITDSAGPYPRIWDLQVSYVPWPHATASSEYPNPSDDYVASKAVDGDMGTYWAGENDQGPYWLALDFGTAQTYNTVVGYWGRAGVLSPKEYVLESSDDGATWTIIPDTYVAA